MISVDKTIALATLAIGLIAGARSFAEVRQYTADLTGSAEVPPNDSKGTGLVTAIYDSVTNKFTYSVNYSELSGAATAAHFHGPAKAGENARPIVPIPASALASPIRGDAKLSDFQGAGLQLGMVYFNIHTSAHPEGEIRGQLIQK